MGSMHNCGLLTARTMLGTLQSELQMQMVCEMCRSEVSIWNVYKILDVPAMVLKQTLYMRSCSFLDLGNIYALHMNLQTTWDHPNACLALSQSTYVSYINKSLSVVCSD